MTAAQKKAAEEKAKADAAKASKEVPEGQEVEKQQIELSEAAAADGTESVGDPNAIPLPTNESRAADSSSKPEFGPFKMKRGAHNEGGTTHTKSTGPFMSKTNLVERFGNERVEYVGK